MDFDLILAGGGLHNGLIALRLAQLRPELRVAIVESGAGIGGNHTWSSFARDLTAAQAAWTAPLIAHRWDRYSVRFPGHSRTLDMGYVSATSERLEAAVRAALPPASILTGVPVAALDATSVTLADQRVLTARAVIDGRGQGPTAALDLRWQKFLGLEIELAEDHGLTGPIIMDATVPQSDGYRFVYTLPFGPRHVLIEDTYFSDGSDLAPKRLRQHLADYAAAAGWTIVRTIREEHGILPIALGGDMAALWAEGVAGVGRVGLRAARFNPATGYSFPDAVRTADLVAALPDFTPDAVDGALRAAAVKAWDGRSLFRLLNKMLFLAAYPHERRHILERFYRLDAGLIGRFYASESTFLDRIRILIGKPPIPIPRAVRALLQYEFKS